jgi:hypothetical protein
MRRVGGDGQQERLLLGPVEVANRDLVVTAKLSGPQAMHTVDDPHAAPVNKNWRQSILKGCQHLDVADVLSSTSW